MDSSRDLYNFAGDTANDGEVDQRKNFEANTAPNQKSTSEMLRQEAYRSQDNMPPIAPDRHRHESELLQNKDGRPIIIEYNNIYIDSSNRRNPAAGVPEYSQNQPDTPSPSLYNVQPDNINAPYRPEQIYPHCQPDIVYGAGAPNFSAEHRDFRGTPERYCNPGYTNYSEMPNHQRYEQYPNYRNYSEHPSYPNFQNYPYVSNYPVFPNGIYNCAPQPFIPNPNTGKLDQIAHVLREMGPLAFEITALTTGRREFHHYPGVYGYRSNYYGCNNDFANTIPIYPYRCPLRSY
jgi:hypothetical protein